MGNYGHSMTTLNTRSLFYRIPSHTLKKGDTVEGHAHTFHHDTWVMVGGFRVQAWLPDGTKYDQEHWAPSHVDIAAGVCHALTALEDGSVYWCVYPFRDHTTGELLDGFNGEGPAYG
jgi:hypothetical protein